MHVFILDIKEEPIAGPSTSADTNRAAERDNSGLVISSTTTESDIGIKTEKTPDNVNNSGNVNN